VLKKEIDSRKAQEVAGRGLQLFFNIASMGKRRKVAHTVKREKRPASHFPRLLVGGRRGGRGFSERKKGEVKRRN